MSGTASSHVPSRTMHQLERRMAIRTVFLGLAGLIGLVALFVLGKGALHALQVKKVRCVYASTACPSALEDHVKPLHGALILRLPHLSTARQYTMKRSFPDSVSVTFAQAPVLLSFHTSEATASAYSLSTDGHVDHFATKQDQAISAMDDELSTYTDWAPVNPDVLTLYTAIVALGAKSDHVALSKMYRTSETETILVFANELVAIIRDEGAQKMLNSLQAVLTSPTMDTSKKTIDLRFDNPVIR